MLPYTTFDYNSVIGKIVERGSPITATRTLKIVKKCFLLRLAGEY